MCKNDKIPSLYNWASGQPLIRDKVIRKIYTMQWFIFFFCIDVIETDAMY